MTVLAVASVKHSPGATTLALALAAAWAGDPARQSAAVVVEVDPAGGDLAARLGLPAEPGLASLAAEARHGDPLDVGAHARPLPCGGWFVPAPRPRLPPRCAWRRWRAACRPPWLPPS